MTIYKYEIKQLKRSIIIWSAVLAVSIFFMLPVYMELFSSAGQISITEFSDNPFFEILGTNIEILSTPMGAYAFLTSFVLVACAINGMKLGLETITKEYINGTTDFLFTKPHSRSKIFISKLLASLTAVLIIGAAYFLASWAGMEAGAKGNFDFRILILIALSTVFIQVLFLALGMLSGVVYPHLRNPIIISVGVAFVSYVFGAFARKMSIAAVGYLSPYIYFDNMQTIINNGYRSKYMILFIILSVIFIIGGHYIFCRKDVMPTS
ncbi:MAG: ABC transporter permease subunit [Bacillota bacterium]